MMIKRWIFTIDILDYRRYSESSSEQNIRNQVLQKVFFTVMMSHQSSLGLLPCMLVRDKCQYSSRGGCFPSHSLRIGVFSGCCCGWRSWWIWVLFWVLFRASNFIQSISFPGVLFGLSCWANEANIFKGSVHTKTIACKKTTSPEGLISGTCGLVINSIQIAAYIGSTPHQQSPPRSIGSLGNPIVGLVDPN